MAMINSALRLVFELIQLPFSGLPTIVGVTLWSVVTAVGVLLVYKRASDQDGLGAVKRRIHAGLFEIRLFNDDLGAILRAQGQILRHNLTYLRLSLKPMIFFLPPLVLILGQLQFFYGYRALDIGESTLLSIRLAEGWQEHEAVAGDSIASRPPLELELPAGVIAETEGVWAPALGEMSWRIRAEAPGRHELRFLIGSEAQTKRLQVTDQVVQLAPVRPGSGLLDQLAAPAEAPIPAGSIVDRISLMYPDGEIWFGTNLSSEIAWMVVYFILTMVFAFALRSPLGVNI